MERKELIILILLGTVILSIPSRAMASYEFHGLGAKGGSMGYAFTAIADDVSALYWNPAGLTQLKGIQLQMDLYNMNWREGNDLVYNSDNPSLLRGEHFLRVRPTEPRQFDKKKKFIPMYNPGIGVHFPWKGFHIGAGIYNPLGTTSTWSDTVVDIAGNARVDGSLAYSFFLTVSNVSIARELWPGLSVGAGFNFLYGILETDIDKDYLTEDHDASRDYSYDFESKATGWSTEGVFGIHYKILPQLTVGGVLRTGGKIIFNGRAFARHSALSDVAEHSSYHENLLNPLTAGIGVALKPIPRLTLVVQWRLTDWTKVDWSFNYDNNDPRFTFLRDSGQDGNWHSRGKWSFGFAYQYSENLAFRGGWFDGPSALPGGFANMATFPIEESPGFTGGFGYKFGKWTLDFHTNYHYSTGGISREVPNREHDCLVLEIGLTRRFR